MNIEQLNDLEEICQLKARYVRLVDTKDWESWRECFTEDFEASIEGAPRHSKDEPLDKALGPRDRLVDGCAQMFDGVTTLHQIYSPEIKLTSATTATGVWAQFDHVQFSTCNFKGWGHYHDDYVKIDGQWKLKKTRVTRVLTEEEWL